MSKRPNAADFVKVTGSPVTMGVNWYQRLPSADQNFVNDVVNELIANPNARLYLVAENLTAELNIRRHPNTVAKTLKQMVKHGQAKREETCR